MIAASTAEVVNALYERKGSLEHRTQAVIDTARSVDDILILEALPKHVGDVLERYKHFYDTIRKCTDYFTQLKQFLEELGSGGGKQKPPGVPEFIKNVAELKRATEIKADIVKGLVDAGIEELDALEEESRCFMTQQFYEVQLCLTCRYCNQFARSASSLPEWFVVSSDEGEQTNIFRQFVELFGFEWKETDDEEEEDEENDGEVSGEKTRILRVDKERRNELYSVENRIQSVIDGVKKLLDNNIDLIHCPDLPDEITTFDAVVEHFNSNSDTMFEVGRLDEAFVKILKEEDLCEVVNGKEPIVRCYPRNIFKLAEYFVTSGGGEAEDEEEDGEENGEEDGEENGEEDGEENGEEDGEENGEEDGEENREGDGEENGEEDGAEGEEDGAEDEEDGAENGEGDGEEDEEEEA